MDAVPLSWAVGALVVLLLVSAFFSIAETSMMAINRYKLARLVARRRGGARRVAALLKRTDLLLGTILIGNNLVNAAIATLASLIAIRLFGEGHLGWAVTASTLAVSFLIVVFAEVTPKVIGATFPVRLRSSRSSQIRKLGCRNLRSVAWLGGSGVLHEADVLLVFPVGPATADGLMHGQHRVQGLDQRLHASSAPTGRAVARLIAD